jgi:hypothetical protein
MLALHHQTKLAPINTLHVVPDGTHNETWMQGGQPYWDAIKAFITAAVQARGAATTASNLSADAAVSTSSKPAHASSSSSSSSSSASIPIMPNKLFGMVKELINKKDKTNNSHGGKKEL